MEKNKYQRAPKEERRKAREAFFKTEFGAVQKKRLNRLIIYSVLLVACAIYFIVDNIMNENTVSNYVLAVFFIIFAAIFIYGRHYVIVKNTNDFMIKNKWKN